MGDPIINPGDAVVFSACNHKYSTPSRVVNLQPHNNIFLNNNLLLDLKHRLILKKIWILKNSRKNLKKYRFK